MKTLAIMLLMFTPAAKSNYVVTRIDSEQAAVTCVAGTVPTVTKLSESTITVTCKAGKQ